MKKIISVLLVIAMMIVLLGVVTLDLDDFNTDEMLYVRCEVYNLFAGDNP